MTRWGQGVTPQTPPRTSPSPPQPPSPPRAGGSRGRELQSRRGHPSGAAGATRPNGRWREGRGCTSTNSTPEAVASPPLPPLGDFSEGNGMKLLSRFLTAPGEALRWREGWPTCREGHSPPSQPQAVNITCSRYLPGIIKTFSRHV